MNYCNCPNCRTDNCPNAESWAEKAENENDTFVMGDIIRLRKVEAAQREEIEKLREHLHETEKQVQFYAGEGRKTRPDMVEWQALANKKRKTKVEVARMGEIARAVRDEDMDAPERLAEIKSLRQEIGKLRAALKKLLITSAGMATQYADEPHLLARREAVHIFALTKPQPSQT